MQAEYSLALFGPRNAGKTVYLASLYSGIRTPGDADTVQISTRDDGSDGTHRYLSRITFDLSNGRWPQATVFDELKRLEFDVAAGSRSCRILLPDVGGEVVRRAVEQSDFQTAEQHLKHAILDEYRMYDGYLIVLPAQPPSSTQSLELKWEIDALLQAVREAERGGQMARPLAIVLSKWDRVSEGLTDGVREETAAVAFFQQHFPHLASSVAGQCRRWRVFPVSATGHFSTSQPPYRLRPFNIGAPIRWLLDLADDAFLEEMGVRLEETQSFIDEHADQLFTPSSSAAGRQPYEVASESLAHILTRVPSGPLAARAHKLQDGLTGQWRKRQARWLGLGAAFIAVALLLALAVEGARSDEELYRQTSALMQGEASVGEEESVIGRVTEVLAGPGHWMGRLRGRWSRLEHQLEKYTGAFEQRQLETILQSKEPASNAEAERVFDLASKFLRRFEGSPNCVQVGRIAETARQKILGAEEPEWAAILQFDSEHPTDYEQIVARYKSYLNQPLFQRHRAEAERRQAGREMAWDKSLYLPIQNQAADQKSGSKVERLDELCRRYLKAPCARKSMEDPVRRWVEWFGRMQSGLPLRVQVDTVLIQSGSRWHSLFYTPNVYVTVGSGQEARATAAKKADIGFDRSFADSPLSPLPWRWGQPVTVNVVCTNFSTEVLTHRSASTEPFGARLLNEQIAFDEGKIGVTLRCPDVVPPDLPPWADGLLP